MKLISLTSFLCNFWLLPVIAERLDISSNILDTLADEVRNSETESMVEALANLMGKPSNQDNPNKMRKEIIQLIRNPKFKKASEGRKTVKALRLPTGVVNLLNAKISVS